MLKAKILFVGPCEVSQGSGAPCNWGCSQEVQLGTSNPTEGGSWRYRDQRSCQAFIQFTSPK